MRKWVETDASGNVMKSYSGDSIVPPSEATEVTGDVLAERLTIDHQREVRHDGTRLREKPRVRLRVDKRRIVGDGVDKAIFTLEGGLERVRVKVGRQHTEVRRGQPLTVTSRTAGRMVVKVDDPDVFAVPSEIRLVVTGSGGAGAQS